jgi:Enoyl-CoA hydratase/isomerase
LRWGFLPHGELPEAFHDIGSDRENRVVILTGTGEEFSGPRATPGTSSFPVRPSIERIDRIHWEGRHLLMNLLNIEAPVISAINGPAWRHSEIPLLCDIVLAADTAQFQDSAHFSSDVVPGDGMHIVYPLLLGMNRGRYFLMTGQTLDAAEACVWGSSPKCCRPTSSCRGRGNWPGIWPADRPCCCAIPGCCSPNICAARCMTFSATGSQWRAWRCSRSPRPPPRRIKPDRDPGCKKLQSSRDELPPAVQ